MSEDRETKRVGWNFAFVPKDVFLSADLSHADVRLYSYILWRAGLKENAWPSVQTMADDLHMSYAAVKLSLKSLLKHDWIRRERTFKGSSTTYVYEKQADCRSANLLAHARLTGKPNDGQQDSRLNESQLTTVIEPVRRKAPPPQCARPKAVDIFREATGRYPNKTLWDSMAQAVGDDTDLWRDVVTGWVITGFNPTNVGGMFEFFKRREIPGATSRGKTNANHRPTRTDIPDDDPEGLARARRLSGG